MNRPDISTTLLDELQCLQRAYVNLLEIGRDRIIQYGGTCDPVDVMEASDPVLARVRATIALAQSSVSLPSELNEDLVEILGMPCFRAGPIAHLFNAAGEAKVPPRAENEQAFVLHWMLGLYLEHGEKWRTAAAARLRAMQEQLQDARFARTEG